MHEGYLILDIGTGNSRPAVVTETGEILGIAKENTPLYSDPHIQGSQCFCPEQWAQMNSRLARKAIT